MGHFDINKYKFPDLKKVDMRVTRENFELFMGAYGAVREKVGKNRMPKITQSFSPTSATPHREYDGDAERFLIEREIYMPEFEELDAVFWDGYTAISNTLRQDGTERRRQIFMLRYVYGINVQAITERTYLGKTTIVEESRVGFIQFCKATGILVTKDETKPLVPVD